MNVLVSSKTLFNQLNKLDIKNHGVDKVELTTVFGELRYLKIYSGDKEVEIHVESNDKDQDLINYPTRWDWIKKELGRISEQPVVLSIGKFSSTITMTF